MQKRFFEGVIVVLFICVIVRVFADENDTEKFLENIRQIIKKGVKGKVKKEKYSKAHKPKIKKRIIHKLALPFKQFKKEHTIIKKDTEEPLSGNQQQFARGDGRQQLPSLEKLLPYELTKSIRRLFRQNPSLMPFRFPTIKKSEGKLAGSQDKEKNISSDNSQQMGSEKLPFRGDIGYISDLRAWLSEIILRSAQFWRFVVDIFGKIIDAGLYGDFVQDYCSVDTDLMTGRRDYRYNPPQIQEIFTLSNTMLQRLDYLPYLYMSKLMAPKLTLFLRHRDLCHELSKINGFFKGVFNLVDDIEKCVYENEKCEDLGKNLDVFIKLVKKYFSLINKIVPALIEATLLPLLKSGIGKHENDGSNNTIVLIYNLVWEKEYLSTFIVGAVLENNIRTIFSLYPVCEGVRDAMKNYILKLTLPLSDLFFCKGVCKDYYTTDIDTIISKILRQYNNNKTNMISSVDTMIIDNRQKFVSIVDDWIKQFRSLKDVEKFCLTVMLSYIKLQTNDFSKNKYKEINEKVDEIMQISGVYDLAELIYISFLDPIDIGMVLGKSCIERLPEADGSVSLDGDVNRANAYINYVKYLDVIIVINEVRFAIKSCWKEVKEPLEDAQRRCGEGFLSFFKNVIEKNDIFKSMKEYLDEWYYKGVKDVLQEVYHDVMPVISLSKIDMFFEQLRFATANKKYMDIIKGKVVCCDKCMSNSECLEHSSNCSVFIGDPQWGLEGIPIDKLKSVCPIEGVKPVDFFSPESRCILVLTGVAWPPLDMECNRKGVCPSDCPIEIADKLRNVVHLLDPSKTTFGGKNFCQIIDEFYSCCQNCTDCARTKIWCTEKFTSVNLRKKYLGMLKDKIGKKYFDIIMERIKGFETITPFSEKAIEKIRKQMGLECMK